MEGNPEEFDLQTLSVALGDLRDSWVLISMALKDQFADEPSPLRDEVMVQVERQLARLREGERGNFE
jgi:hypothetical protein